MKLFQDKTKCMWKCGNVDFYPPFFIPHFSRRYREDIEKIAPKKKLSTFLGKDKRKRSSTGTLFILLQHCTITLIYESIYSDHQKYTQKYFAKNGRFLGTLEGRYNYILCIYYIF